MLATRKRVLGEEHPQTLLVAIKLAATYFKQGKNAETEMLERDVLATRKRVLAAQRQTR